MNSRRLATTVALLSALVGLAALVGPAAATQTTGTPTATPAGNGTASVDYPDQRATGQVTVESVTLSDGGYVVILNESGQPVGHSSYLEAGSHESVTVNVTPDFTRGQVSIAQVHIDDGDRTYEPKNDTAYIENGVPVSDTAYIRTGNATRGTATPTATTAGGTPIATGTPGTGTPTGATATTTPGFTVLAALSAVAALGAVLLARR